MAEGQTFQDHIRELRRRIAWVVGAIFISAGIAYALRKSFIVWLQRPLGKTLYYTSPTGSFNFVLKIAMVVGMFIALPIAVYHLIRFIEPALPKRISKRLIAGVLTGSFLLAVAGIAFGYYVMIPMSLKFFGDFSTAQVQPWISADQYLSYMINNLIIFALIFQIPLFTLFINRIKPLKPSKLLKYQRHVVVAAFAFALVLPFTYDPITQFVVAIPIVVLYYMSILLVALANSRRNRKLNKKAVELVPQAVTSQLITDKELVAALEETDDTKSRQPAPVPKYLLPQVIPIYEPTGRSVDGFAIKPNPKIELAQPRTFEAKPIDRPDNPNMFRIDGFLPPSPASA